MPTADGADRSAPQQSRATAAAQRRIIASAARRRTVSEVMLVTSKTFPSQQYQELLNFLKGLQLPPDVSSLFTTVRNERVAERKAALSSHSAEDVDGLLTAVGSKLELLSKAQQELGLSSTMTHDGATSPPLPFYAGRSAPLPTLSSVGKLDDYLAEIEGSSAAPALGEAVVAQQAAAGGSGGTSKTDAAVAVGASRYRATLTDGLYQSGIDQTGSGGFTVGVDAIPAPAFVVDSAGVVLCWNGAIAQLTGHLPDAVLGKRLADAVVPDELAERVHAALVGSRAADLAIRLMTSDGRQLELHVRLSTFKGGAGAAGSSSSPPATDCILAVGIDVTTLVGKAAASSQEARTTPCATPCTMQGGGELRTASDVQAASVRAPPLPRHPVRQPPVSDRYTISSGSSTVRTRPSSASTPRPTSPSGTARRRRSQAAPSGRWLGGASRTSSAPKIAAPSSRCARPPFGSRAPALRDGKARSADGTALLARHASLARMRHPHYVAPFTRALPPRAEPRCSTTRSKARRRPTSSSRCTRSSRSASRSYSTLRRAAMPTTRSWASSASARTCVPSLPPPRPSVLPPPCLARWASRAADPSADPRRALAARS